MTALPNALANTSASNRQSQLEVDRSELGSKFISYQDGLARQRQIHQSVRDGQLNPTIWMLEHEATFTAGKRTEPQDIPNTTINVTQTDRGGRITWHGPGQLVAYPIVPLPHPLDVVAYVRVLEQVMIDTCAHFGVTATRVEGRSGAWCEPTGNRGWRKIGAIGVRVAGGTTMHGCALNVNCDLSWSDQIVPCGISDADVTSLAVEGINTDVLAVADVMEPIMLTKLGTYLGYEDAS